MNIELPLFTYGALKAGEMAHRIVEPFLAGATIPTMGSGVQLLIVDGVALAIEEPNSFIEGELLKFADPSTAYKRVNEFEDVPNSYVWVEIETNNGRANALISAAPDIKTRHDREHKWTSAQDGLLAYGIPWSFERLSKIRGQITSTAHDYDFWSAYHDLQSTFQLLWSLTERILLFHDGPQGQNVNLGEKISWLKDMKRHPGLKAAVDASHIAHGMGVRSNLEPSAPQPGRAGATGFPVWYDMRNNIVHRGKGTRVEKGPLWTATVDLHNTLSHYLQHNSAPIAELWSKLTDEHAKAYSSWLYRIQK